MPNPKPFGTYVALGPQHPRVGALTHNDGVLCAQAVFSLQPPNTACGHPDRPSVMSELVNGINLRPFRGNLEVQNSLEVNKSPLTQNLTYAEYYVWPLGGIRGKN